MPAAVPRRAPAKRWSVSWALAAASVLALPLSWYWWSAERAKAAGLQQARQHASVLAPLQSRVAAQLAEWGSVRADGAAMQQKLESLGEVPQRWQRRSITIEKERMSRVEAERYLHELVSDERALFLPSAILIKAARQEESVFAVHQGQDSPDALVVTIKADLYTRSEP